MNAKRILGSLMFLCVVIWMMMVMAPSVHAAMPENSEGKVSDGVDFGELLSQGNGIYYGQYRHVTAMNDTGDVTEQEKNPTPILWLPMGEESKDSKITVLSKYVLDAIKFRITEKKVIITITTPSYGHG